MFLIDLLDFKDTKREYSDEGFLKVPARISRVGVQSYLAKEMGVKDKDPKAVINVYRPEEEVFSDVALSSFASKPVTNNHPPELLTSKNSKHYSVGMSSAEVVKDGIYATTILNIFDDDTIKQIESGKVELSNGYTADIEWVQGVTPAGEQYDAIQRNIKGNHVAVVERGRAGSACRVADFLPDTGDEIIMAQVTIDGVDFEVSDQVAQAVEKQLAKLTDAEEAVKETKSELKKKEDEEEEAKKKAKSTTDSLQAKLDDAVTRIPSSETLDALVSERAKLVDDALKLQSDFKWEGKDSDTIRKEIVELKCPAVKVEDASVDYITSRFDALLESIETNPQQSVTDAMSQQVKTGDTEIDNRPLDVIARDNFMADSQSAWKKGDK